MLNAYLAGRRCHNIIHETGLGGVARAGIVPVQEEGRAFVHISPQLARVDAAGVVALA